MSGHRPMEVPIQNAYIIIIIIRPTVMYWYFYFIIIIIFANKYLQMVLTLFDGAVITGSIPAIVESGDERFIMSYSKDVIAPTLIGHVS